MDQKVRPGFQEFLKSNTKALKAGMVPPPGLKTCVLFVAISLMAKKLPTARGHEIKALAKEVSIFAGIPFSELERRMQSYRNASVTAQQR